MVVTNDEAGLDTVRVTRSASPLHVLQHEAKGLRHRDPDRDYLVVVEGQGPGDDSHDCPQHGNIFDFRWQQELNSLTGYVLSPKLLGPPIVKFFRPTADHEVTAGRQSALALKTPPTETDIT